MSRCDSLRAEELHAALIEPYIGNEILVADEISSTNDWAWQMAQAGSRDGLVLFAESQTGGRGQRGNRWESVAHLGLWFSLLLRPAIQPADSARLTNWAMQTIARTIEETMHLETQIKMPNDIHILKRKVAGVLVEMRVEKSGAYAAIVGVGVNVNQTADDFSEEVRASAGSLAMAVGRQVDRHLLAVALLRNLDRSYRAVFTA